jgi:hypothetical protein
VAPNHALVSVRAWAKRWQGYVQAGLLSREISEFGVPTRLTDAEGNIAGGVMRESPGDPARSENQGMYGIFMRENREIPLLPVRSDDRAGRPGNAEAVSLR